MADIADDSGLEVIRRSAFDPASDRNYFTRTMNGWHISKVGRKVEAEYIDASTTNYHYKENLVTIMTVQVIKNLDGTFKSAERIA